MFDNKLAISVRKREYEMANKERIAARHRQYYLDNKEQISAQNKDHEMKERIAARTAIVIHCEACDCYHRRGEKSRHYNTQKHINNTSHLENASKKMTNVFKINITFI
jgi:hypothetical protein